MPDASRQVDVFDLVSPSATASTSSAAPLLGACVLGIDPSLTGFAICYSVPGKRVYEGEWSSKPTTTVRGRVARYEQLIRGTLEIVLAQKPQLILIEAYAYQLAGGKQSGHAMERAELGGILRLKLCERTQCPIVEVSPTTLKKFVTGAGTGSKDFMVSTLAKNYVRTFTSDNQADAFALCQLGLALTGQVDVRTKPEREYLGKLKKGWALP